MPYPNPVVLADVKYTLRHIGPKGDYLDGQGNVISGVWPEGIASEFTFLNRSDFVARPLPVSGIPDSPDFVQGTWTGRVGDAGEATAVFPNAVASDGGFWRERFDATGHLQWVEFYADSELEQVVVLDNVGPIDPTQVQLHGFDGFWLCKKAYERDWIVTQAPRDVIMRGCSLWMPALVDKFPSSERDSFNGGTPNPWTVTTSGAAVGMNAFIKNAGNLFLTIGNATGGLSSVLVDSTTVTLPAATGVWQAFLSIPTEDLEQGSDSVARGRFVITESSGDQYGLTIAYTDVNGITAAFVAQQDLAGHTVLPNSPLSKPILNQALHISGSYTMMLESDGMWVWAFVNGLLVGCIRRKNSTTTSLQTQIGMLNSQPGAPASGAIDMTVDGVMVRAQVPYLQSEADPGDFVLPGDVSTFPSGGLFARYFNDADLRSDPDYLYKALNPSRTQAYGATNPAEAVDRQDSGGGAGPIAGQGAPPVLGGNQNYSVMWFGAIWLEMSQGDYQFQVQIPGSSASCAIKIWVGRTAPGTEVLSKGFFGFIAGPQTYQFTVAQADLEGSLSYGGGMVARDGWYPFVVHYVMANPGGVAPTLQFFFNPNGAGYLDPGGTSIPGGSGAAAMTVPKTSFSPLGCVDNRFQGVSHFDLIQQTAQAWGHQFAVEPKQLEAVDSDSNLSLFPGVLAPRIREGHDTDVVLAIDENFLRDAEGVLNPSNTQEITDHSTSIYGNGSGLQTGGTDAQLQSMVFDPATMAASLFDAQMWQDFSDAQYPQLLTAFLNAQLSLVLEPWQLLTADPYGRNRMAFTWPLPGSLQAFRWRPGDGLQIRVLQINVWDSLPRQMLVMQRTFVPDGIIATTATFINRPKTFAHTLKQALYKSTRWQRNYQRRHLTLSGNPVDSATVSSGNPVGPSSTIALQPGDRVAGLVLIVTDNSGPVDFGVYINGNDVTTGQGLFGPWHKVPCAINLMAAYASGIGGSSSDGMNHLRVHVNYQGSSASNYSYQAFADVIR